MLLLQSNEQDFSYPVAYAQLHRTEPENRTDKQNDTFFDGTNSGRGRARTRVDTDHTISRKQTKKPPGETIYSLRDFVATGRISR